jgi:3-dehydroquinate dehydratase-1
MKTVKVGSIEIGKGMPKICVPITASTIKGIKEEADNIYNNFRDDIDLVELRIDFFNEVNNLLKVDEVLKTVRESLKEIPLIFTFRSLLEGGEREISIEEYEKLLILAVDSGYIDIIDIEIMKDFDGFNKLSDYAHEKGILVIASSHDFSKTPTQDEILFRLMKMSNEGADIPKIAVMPKCEEDVVTLLKATVIAKTCIDNPIVTISMGKLGAVTRIAGETFGSAITFATAGKKSAPGQIEVKKLKEAMDLLH